MNSSPKTKVACGDLLTCFPDAGNHDKLEMKIFKVEIFPTSSPSAPHFATILSSLHESSWQSGDHDTAVVISVSDNIRVYRLVYDGKCKMRSKFTLPVASYVHVSMLYLVSSSSSNGVTENNRLLAKRQS